MNQDSKTFHVESSVSQKTLVAALRDWLSGESWGRVRKLVRLRHILLNGNLCLDEGRRLTEGDVVKVLPYSMPLPPREEDVVIRYLDPHVVVVEKPAGMTSLRHAEERRWPRRRKQFQPTLDEVLPQLIQARERQRVRRKGTGRLPRVRAVHRLDRDTSGLMVFARTALAERHLVQQFRQHAVHRAYQAIACGDVRAQTIQSRLVRDRGDGRRGSTKLEGVGKPAVTHVKPLERLGQYTLVECRLETGRTHQIRIHLAENGHMVCGEKVYDRSPFGKSMVDESGAQRHALHAAELGFVHPASGKSMYFTIPLPEDMAQLLKRLRSRGGATPTNPARRRDLGGSK